MAGVVSRSGLSRLALLIVAAGIFVLLVVIAAVITGAAFAPVPRDRAAARTLDMLLRLAPGYRPRPPDAREPVGFRNGVYAADLPVRLRWWSWAGRIAGL
jgi:hypothetical protein